MELAGEDPLIGQYTGSFRLERVLGRGAMGTVYLGVHRVIGSRVAVKVIHPELVSNAQLLARFEDEARAVNRVAHDNVVSIFDIGTLPGGRPFLVMELLEGKALSSALQKPMPPAELVRYLVQTCSALEAAHAQGVVHRDLKPDNIFIVERAGRADPLVKILDFGVARLFGDDGALERTSAEMILGTPAYMAPEQCNGSELDGRADLYALGILAWRALVGKVPFRGSLIDVLEAHRSRAAQPVHEANPNVPESLSRVVMKALAKSPAERWSSAAEMKAALESCGASLEAGTTSKAELISVIGADNQPLRQAPYSQLTRGGVFLQWEAPLPSVFARLLLELPTPGRPIRVRAEVVRHVSGGQARAWGMPSGIGVQFLEMPDSTRARLSGWLGDDDPEKTPASGTRLPTLATKRHLPAPVDDPDEDPEDAWDRRIDEIFIGWYERASGNHYQALNLRPDADFAEIREAADTVFRDLTSGEPNTVTQARQVKGALARIRTAMATLCDPTRRAAYDAELGNFHGVAMCIAAGLSADALSSLRDDYLARSDRAAEKTRVCVDTAESLDGTGLFTAAREIYERALRQDPLNLELHERLARTLRALGEPWPVAMGLAI